MYYDKIDYSIIKNSWESIKDLIELPFVIHIVGTNGKGSTGRYIASLLYQNQKSVLHYSSPHILSFNERIWIDGEDSSNEELNFAHQFLQKNLDSKSIEKLTYFEYTTLLTFVLSSKKDFLVLEAGLGGEFDATNVVQNDLSVFTPIGYDHQSFLGETIEAIATTKMKSCDKTFILARQKYKEVYTIKDTVLKDKKEIILDQSVKSDIDINSLPEFLQNNFILALNVLKFLKIDTTHAVLPKLKGRFEYYKSNIILDVGHNSLAAHSIAEQLKKLQKKVILIYNCYEDKDYKNILRILKPYLEEIQIIPCEEKRIISKDILVNEINILDIKIQTFLIDKISNEKTYLVFGSFSVVEQFLKEYESINEKR